jgi:hypothetical protein
MIYQDTMNVIDWSQVFAPVIVLFMMVMLIILMIYFMKVKDKFSIILLIYFFSLAVGIGSINIPTFPLNPYFQIFFILFMSLLLLNDAIKTFTGD